MQRTATSPELFFSELPEDRQAPMQRLRQTILDKLPSGFEERVSGGMLNYVVPHTTFPAGYHCDPSQPLPFLSIASQKNFIALYHMGLYADPELLHWFTESWKEQSKTKLDMGKSCIRFKKLDALPYGLIGELVSKVDPAQWIATYEKVLKRP